MIVDARGLLCPHPVIELAKCAKNAPGGTLVHLLSDDAVSLTDIPAWCRMRGATLREVIDRDDHWEFVVVTARSGD